MRRLYDALMRLLDLAIQVPPTEHPLHQVWLARLVITFLACAAGVLPGVVLALVPALVPALRGIIN